MDHWLSRFFLTLVVDGGGVDVEGVDELFRGIPGYMGIYKGA